MAWQPPGRHRNHQLYRYGDGYNFLNKNQPDMGTASPSGVEVQMEVDTGTRKDKSLPILNQLLTELSSIESLVKPAKQELESLNTKLRDNGGDQELKEKEAILAATVCELEKLRQENGTVTEERNQLVEKIHIHEENIKSIQEKYKKQGTELIRAHELNAILQVTLDSTNNDLDKVTQESSSIKQMLNKEKDELREKLRKAEAELSDTKSRLSKIMGQKLSDNNPNIADLSDTNRPTKLAERYQELYDNQWTDAFEAIETYYADEKKCIGILLNILKDVKLFCENLCETQMQEIGKVIRLTAKTNRSILSDSINKQVKDFLKGTADISVSEIQEMYCKKRSTKHAIQDARVRPFIDECITICWLMSVQDPPVVLGKEPPPNSKFDTNFFKHYTKTGLEIDYVVWPSLYLHKGGPLLGKGVAQAKTSLVRQRSRESPKGTSDRAQDKAQSNNDGNQLYGHQGEQTQVQAYGKTPNDPIKAKEDYPMYSQNESGKETRFDPHQRDQAKPFSWDKSKADQGASYDNTASTTRSGAKTIGGRSGHTYISQQHMNLAQSARPPAVTNHKLANLEPQSQAYTPTANDLRDFEYYFLYPNYYSEGHLLKLKGPTWFDAFLRFKENKNNHSVSDV